MYVLPRVPLQAVDGVGVGCDGGGSVATPGGQCPQFVPRPPSVKVSAGGRPRTAGPARAEGSGNHGAGGRSSAARDGRDRDEGSGSFPVSIRRPHQTRENSRESIAGAPRGEEIRGVGSSVYSRVEHGAYHGGESRAAAQSEADVVIHNSNGTFDETRTVIRPSDDAVGGLSHRGVPLSARSPAISKRPLSASFALRGSSIGDEEEGGDVVIDRGVEVERAADRSEGPVTSMIAPPRGNRLPEPAENRGTCVKEAAVETRPCPSVAINSSHAGGTTAAGGGESRFQEQSRGQEQSQGHGRPFSDDIADIRWAYATDTASSAIAAALLSVASTTL